MKRIGVIGFALALAIAICAVASASAAEPYQYGFKASEYPVEQLSTNTNIHGFEVTGAVSLCEEAKFDTNENGAPNPTGPQHTLEVHPVYNKCSISLPGGTGTATIRTNKCNYVLTATEPGTVSAEKNNGAVQIKCVARGEAIEVESLGVVGCIIKTGPQSLKGVGYINNDPATGQVAVGSEVENISYTAAGACGIAGSGTTAKYRRGEQVLGVDKLCSPTPCPAEVKSVGVKPATTTAIPVEVNFNYPHSYSEGSVLATTQTVVAWGNINLIETEGPIIGAKATCHNVAAGTASNPAGANLNGKAGEGATVLFDTFSCEQENICEAGNDKSVVVSAMNLPWKNVLTEETLNTIRQETTAPNGPTGVKVVFHCTKAGVPTSEVPYIIGKKKGSAEAEPGQRPAVKNGTSALHPTLLNFEALSGELEVEGSLGKTRSRTEGAVRTLGYEAQELGTANTP
jgi:hypothetical protein